MDKNDRQSSREGDAVSGWSRRKFASFAAITVLLGLAVSLGAVELFLRYHDRQIAHSEHMEPGLIGYDAELGWQLTPGWSGAHHHYDYEVEYDIDANGFRVDPHAETTGPRVAVLGDSFTFGLGVANDETFVSRLNAENETRQNYLNLSVPGYSTDQELLLFRKTAESIKPEVVLLVVYLANDLFDNKRPFPLQADHAKPYFRLNTDRQLVLENTPVPLVTKSAAARNAGLAEVVLGDQKPTAPLLTRTLGRLHIARHLGLFQQPGSVDERIFQTRFDGYISTVPRPDGRPCGQPAGKSMLNWSSPCSPVHRISTIRRACPQATRNICASSWLRGWRERPDIKVIDLAAAMRAAADNSSQPWYFPNEGHLTPQGHQFVARLVSQELQGNSPAANDLQ